MCWMMDRSIWSPPTRQLRFSTMPDSEITATSVVPPPMSTIMLPVGSETGRPTPMAEAIGSSMICTFAAPAWSALSCTARFSTSVMPDGTAISTVGRKIRWYGAMKLFARWMKYRSISSVTAKSAITPAFIGRIALMFIGQRPSMRFASAPTRTTSLSLIATTDGSESTMP